MRHWWCKQVVPVAHAVRAVGQGLEPVKNALEGSRDVIIRFVGTILAPLYGLP